MVFVGLWFAAVAGESCVEVFVGVRVEEEFTAGPTGGERGGVVVDCLGVEEFADVVGGVA